MKKNLLTLLVLLFCAFGVQAEKIDKIVNLVSGGENRSYRLYVPNNVQANAPLVVSLHGANGNQWGNMPMRTAVADEEGFIVVYPQGRVVDFYLAHMNTTGWDASGEENEDVDFIKAIIEDVAKDYSIDRKRIYCCGFSNGGMMTYALSNTCSEIFAAFASISGFPLNEFHFRHTGARPVPFLHIHGKADDFVKYSLMPIIVDEMVARVGANPVPVKTSVSGKYDKSVYEAGEGGFPYVYYEIDAEKSLAVLTLKHCWISDHYRDVLREMFTEMKEKNIKNLAIDLRGNGGGDTYVANELFKYLPIDTYYQVDDFRKIRWNYLTFDFDQGGKTKNKRNTELEFDGKVYVLTDEDSLSSAMLFTEMIADNGLGKVIGEPPAVNHTVLFR